MCRRNLRIVEREQGRDALSGRKIRDFMEKAVCRGPHELTRLWRFSYVQFVGKSRRNENVKTGCRLSCS